MLSESTVHAYTSYTPKLPPTNSALDCHTWLEATHTAETLTYLREKYTCVRLCMAASTFSRCISWKRTRCSLNIPSRSEASCLENPSNETISRQYTATHKNVYPPTSYYTLKPSIWALKDFGSAYYWFNGLWSINGSAEEQAGNTAQMKKAEVNWIRVHGL